MIKKEWHEVFRQSLYFVLAMAGMVLLVGLANWLQGKPLEAETVIIILGLMQLMFSMFLGLSLFALESKQRGMEYMLTLPYSRRRLLLIKLLPRLAAVVLFYLVYVFLYFLIGNDALGVGFTIFGLAYFALFFISFSLSLVHENFIVQSIWAGIALCGYLALCLCVIWYGFFWKFEIPISWIVSNLWQNRVYFLPGLLRVIVVFLLMAVPFVASFFLAFKKFDLKPARAFNRRQLLLFAPLLLLALTVSLGIMEFPYLLQKRSSFDYSNFFFLKNQRLLQASFSGKLVLYDETGRRKVETKGVISWDRLLLEEGERAYLSGFDIKHGSRIIGSLNQADLSSKIVHRAPKWYFLANGYMDIRYDGKYFVYLRRYSAESERPGIDSNQVARSSVLGLVRVDPANGKGETIIFHTPSFRRYYEPWFIGGDERNGLRFWLIARQLHNVLRIWENGRVEDLGVGKGLPVFAGDLLFSCKGHSLQVCKLLDTGSEIVKEIEGEFYLGNRYFVSPGNSQMREIYAERNKRIVRINLANLEVNDIGPNRGYICMLQPGGFYYVEHQTWPPKNTDKWKKLYRLQGGKMVFLKQFDFNDDGYGFIIVEEFGVKMQQMKDDRTWTRFFAFPDLKELKFKKLK